MLKSNLQVISTRWPEIAQALKVTKFDDKSVELIKDIELSMVYQQIQIASSFDQQAEANIQIKPVSKTSKQVTLYGCGLGAVQKQLLKQHHIESITVIILNLSLFKAILTHFDQRSWLSHAKITLQLASQKSNIQLPFIALPAELTLADDESSRIRDMLCLALDDDFIRQHKGIKNHKVKDAIYHKKSLLRQEQDVAALFSNQDTRHFIICAAGPTLESHLSWLSQLKTRDKLVIVAVDAALMPLMQAGITPDIVVSIDANAKKFFAKLTMDQLRDIALVYFPTIDNELIKSWQGKRYVSYSTGELYDDINSQVPKGRLYSAGSVIHPAIDLVVKMGAKTVYLLGADFSFPGNKSHTYWQNEVTGKGAHLGVTNTPHWVLNSLNERVPTLLNFRGYLRDLEQYIALHPEVIFYNGSEKGAKILGTQLWSFNDGF